MLQVNQVRLVQQEVRDNLDQLDHQVTMDPKDLQDLLAIKVRLDHLALLELLDFKVQPVPLATLVHRDRLDPLDLKDQEEI